MLVPKKRKSKTTSKVETPAVEPEKTIEISQDFKNASKSVQVGLIQYRQLINESLSMKQLKRVAIAVCEHPFESTVNISDSGPEFEAVNLGKMIKYEMIRMVDELKKNKEAQKLIEEMEKEVKAEDLANAETRAVSEENSRKSNEGETI